MDRELEPRVLSRRRILSGLIAAPAVLVLGTHMPVRSILGVRQKIITIDINLQIAPSFEWLQSELQSELLKLLRDEGPIPYNAFGRGTVMAALDRVVEREREQRVPAKLTLTLMR